MNIIENYLQAQKDILSHINYKKHCPLIILMTELYWRIEKNMLYQDFITDYAKTKDDGSNVVEIHAGQQYTMVIVEIGKDWFYQIYDNFKQIN